MVRKFQNLGIKDELQVRDFGRRLNQLSDMSKSRCGFAVGSNSSAVTTERRIAHGDDALPEFLTGFMEFDCLISARA